MPQLAVTVSVPTSRTLIDALSDPAALRDLRRRFQALDPGSDLRRLVAEVIDPHLLRIALGPELAGRWASPLDELYGVLRARHPAHFHDVDAAWRRQRSYWGPVVSRIQACARKKAEDEDSSASASAAGHGAVADVTVGPAPPAAAAGSNGGRLSHRRADPTVFGAAPLAGEDVVAVPGAAVPVASEDVEEIPSAGAGGAPPSPAELVAAPRMPKAVRAVPAAAVAPAAVSAAVAAPRLQVQARTEHPVPPLAGAGEELAPVRGSNEGPGGTDAVPVVPPAREDGFGAAALAAALAHSPEAVDALRRRWVAVGGGADAWNSWTLPADVSHYFRSRQR